MNFDCLKDLLSCLRKKKKRNFVVETESTETEISCVKEDAANYDIIDSYNGEDIIYKGINQDKPYHESTNKKKEKTGKKKSSKKVKDAKEFCVGMDNKVRSDDEKATGIEPKKAKKKSKLSKKLVEKDSLDEVENKPKKVNPETDRLKVAKSKGKRSKERIPKKDTIVREKKDSKKTKYQVDENTSEEYHNEEIQEQKIPKKSEKMPKKEKTKKKSKDYENEDKVNAEMKELKLKAPKKVKKSSLVKIVNKAEPKNGNKFDFLEEELLRRNTLTPDDFRKIQDSDSEICFTKNEIEIKDFNSKLRKKIKNLLKKGAQK